MEEDSNTGKAVWRWRHIRLTREVFKDQGKGKRSGD